MVQVESRIGKLSQTDETIYNFLSDFNNFSQLIPADKVKNWEATTDSCKFNVEGLGNTAMKIVEREPNKLIKIQSEQSMVSFNLWIQLKKVEDSDTRIKLTIKADVNAMMAPMIKSPLKKFVDSLVEQAENIKL